MFRPLEAIIRSRFGYPGEGRWVWVANGIERGHWRTEVSVFQRPLSIQLATQTHLPLQDTRILTSWWPPEAETCRLIIKIPYISCNKLFSNSCLVINLNYYKFVVLDIYTLLFSILISKTGMIHLNNIDYKLSEDGAIVSKHGGVW